MRSTTGTIALLLLAIGALVVLVTVDSSNTSHLRASSSRKLYNYSRNKSSSYDGSSGYMNPNYDNGDGSYGSVYSENGSYNGSYGSSGSSNADNYQNQDYENGSYATDDNNYYDSNKAYQANKYNGRDQYWDGQNIQMYNEEEPTIVEEGWTNGEHWSILGKYGGLSGPEVLLLLFLMLLSALFVGAAYYLSSGGNIIDLYQLYCCCGIFKHKNELEEDEEIGDDFEKLED